jgi:diketogulonate reductase-like aldo/keto reductase
MPLSIGSTLKVNNDVEIPRLGLGVYGAGKGEPTRRAVSEALRHGYRLIDTAKMYGNEADVGHAVRMSGIPRDEIFVTTKLSNADHGYDSTLCACEQSLAKLGLTYVDLYLIHWPKRELRHESWKAMVRLLSEGRCRTIGVSNYTVRHLEELLDRSAVVPAVNQVEFSPFLYQKDLLEFCRRHEIQLEAYAPLTRGRRLDHRVLKNVAARVSKTPAQILIRWSLQHDLVVIPKSGWPERIRENAHVFDFSLSSEDMEILDGLSENLRTCWNPTNAP